MAAKNYLVCRLGTERELEVHKNAGAESLLSAGEMLVEVCDNRRIDGIDWAYFGKRQICQRINNAGPEL